MQESTNIEGKLSRITVRATSYGVLMVMLSKILLVMLSYSLLARLLTREEVGIILALTSFMSISLSMSSLGFNLAYTRLGTECVVKNSIAELGALTSVYLRLTILICVPISFLSLVILDMLSCWVVPLYLLIMVAFFVMIRVVLRVYVMRPRIYMDLEKFQMLNNIPLLIVPVGIIAGAITQNIMLIALIWIILGSIFFVYVVVSTSPYKVYPEFHSKKDPNPVIREFYRLILPIALVSALIPLNNRIDSLFITLLVPLDVVAVYLAVSRFGLLISESSRPAIASIFSSLTHTHARDIEIFNRSLGVALRYAFLILSIMIVGSIPIANQLITLLLGANYAVGYMILPLFMAIGVITIIASLLYNISIVLGRVRRYFFVLVSVLLIRLALYIGLLVYGNPTNIWTPLLLAILVMVSHLLLLISLMIAFRNIFSGNIIDILKITILTVPLFILATFTSNYGFIPRITIAVTFPLLLLILSAYLKYFKPIDILILRKILPRRLVFIANALEKLAR